MSGWKYQCIQRPLSQAVIARVSFCNSSWEVDILFLKKKKKKAWGEEAKKLGNAESTRVFRHSPVALTELLLTFLIQLLSAANQVGRGQGSLAGPSLLKTGPETTTFSKRNFKVRVPYQRHGLCSSCWYPWCCMTSLLEFQIASGSVNVFHYPFYPSAVWHVGLDWKVSLRRLLSGSAARATWQLSVRDA